jgi:hypothetical protein
MTKIIFILKDQEGDTVHIESSEMELTELLTAYPKMKAKLAKEGFTFVKQRSPGRPREKVKFDGKTCPKCGSEMWDNRARNAESGKKGPDFRCKNANCSGATTDKNGNKWPFSLWAGQYEVVEK